MGQVDDAREAREGLRLGLDGRQAAVATAAAAPAPLKNPLRESFDLTCSTHPGAHMTASVTNRQPRREGPC